MQANYEALYDKYRIATEKLLEKLVDNTGLDSDVHKAMRYSLLGSGKRIRAVLCIASCDACGGNVLQAIFAAAAVEMLHCYSLIHDDLPCMDDDDMRRGKPSCHKQFGEATALLTGDALLTLAFETLCKISDASASRSCVQILSSFAGYLGMIRGQELDLKAEKKEIDLVELNEIHKNKTSALIRASAKMGAAVAEADEASATSLDEYANNIGLVFQIVDDILDCTSDTATLGKPVGSDAEQNKTTYPKLVGLEKSRQIASELTEKSTNIVINQFPKKSEFLVEFATKLLTRIN